MRNFIYCFWEWNGYYSNLVLLINYVYKFKNKILLFLGNECFCIDIYDVDILIWGVRIIYISSYL